MCSLMAIFIASIERFNKNCFGQKIKFGKWLGGGLGWAFGLGLGSEKLLNAVASSNAGSVSSSSSLDGLSNSSFFFFWASKGPHSVYTAQEILEPQRQTNAASSTISCKAVCDLRE